MSSHALVHERESESVADFDRDSLHTLPLSMIPLDTPGLRRARMIKNARYESVVELFKGEGTGSGQVRVEQLSNVFSEIGEEDFVVLDKLSELPSYDVYSLRIMLREQEIPVNDYDELRLSDGKQRELDQYMRAFTRPLIRQVYGGDDSVQEFSDIIELFRQPDVSKAREKLNLLAEKLDLKLWDIPQFLQDYGDTYLSVSYFRQCLDQVAPIVRDFRAALQELVQHPQMRQDRELVQTCARIAQTVERVSKVINDRFNVFDTGATEMWKDVSADRFRQLKELIVANHAMLGGTLCGLTVCIDAWAGKFPNENVGGPARRAEYIRNELRQGIENIRNIRTNGKAREAGG